MTSRFRIGARGSVLSLRQTEGVCATLAALLRVPAETFEIVPITTSGDKIQDGRLIEAGGKGLFTKELDEAVREKRVHFAVHSLKDLPTRLPDDITLVCVPVREDPRDAFVSLSAKTLADLPSGATIGSASLRRQAQTLHARPDLKVVTLRGNVDTRLKKLENGVADATFLALAGLKRLGLELRAASLVDPHEAPPAACQGALALTALADDDCLRDAFAAFENADARVEIEAERAFLDALDGSCRTPIAALARKSGASLCFIGETLTPNGARRWRRERSITLGPDAIKEARALGRKLGLEIKDEAGDALLHDA